MPRPAPITVEERAFFQMVLAKDKLRKILTTPFDNKGHIPGVSTEDRNWAFDVCRDKPEWAHGILRECGFTIEEST